MKKILLYILFLCLTVSYSQEEASNWYFGENAGIQFDPNTGVITSLDNGQLDTKEGCSSISDENGNLLFYTDGSTVYNQNHVIMENGFGLWGDDSSTQSAIVVPKPEDPNIYYIFTVGSNQNPTGLKYSIVDMTLDNGLGAITSKNLNLLNNCAEKISAVLKDCQSGIIWVMGFGDVTGNGGPYTSFHAFQVTSNGVNTNAVVSTLPNLNIADARGYLKFSPDATMLACANVQSGMYLFDFDSETGIVSNQRFLSTQSQADKPYGIEFSPSSEFLYVATTNDFFSGTAADDNPASHQSALIQYNTTVTNISTTQVVIDDRQLFRGGLQLGPDGKIYRALSSTYNEGQGFLGVINDPNEAGLACNYTHNAVSLGNNRSTQGLPPFITSFFTERIDIIQNGTSSIFLPLCTGENYTLTAEDIPGATYTWSFNGTVISNDDFDLEVNQEGTYEVLIELNTGECETQEGEAVVQYFPYPTAHQTDDINICDDNNDGFWNFDFTIQNDDVLGDQQHSGFSIYYFENEADAISNTNSIDNIYTNIENPQEIFVRIHNDLSPNCYDITSFNIEVFNTPTANNIDTFEVCDDDSDGNNSNGQTTINLQDFNSIVLGNQENSNYNITFHGSLADAESGNNPFPIPYYNQIPIEETIFTRIENLLNTNCFDTNSFAVKVNPIPISNDTNLIQCDEDGINDGFTIFDLTQSIDDITAGADGVTVNFYLTLNDAENSINSINGNSFNNTSNPQVIYAQVVNDISGCFSISQQELVVSTTQVNDFQPEPVCDELESEDGINTFNLDDFTVEILSGLPSDLTISYYESYNDALVEENPLASPYNNTIPYNQTLFARVENDNACYGISEINLVINPLPNLEEDISLLYCLNDYPNTITLEAGIINDSPSNYQYLWTTNEITSEIEINEIGVYTVTVTNIYGCSKQRTFIVEPSNIATFNNIEVIDATQNNIITVFVSGEGEYEYALYIDDDVYIPYQESHIFTNVAPGGIYTVHVKDIKNDCGVVTELVSVIGFPKFFTPNNDGDHDTWQVYGISAQFQPNTKIYIFDRYGKLIKELHPLEGGWDGTYNGNLMPNSDYWFWVTLQDGRVFKSHFALKR